MRFTITLLFLFILNSSFNPAPKKGSLKELFSFIAGNFSTTNQRENLPDSVLYNFAPGKPWLSHLYAKHIPISIPAIGEKVIFLEWREKATDGIISRQRLWVFDEVAGKLTMQFYSFKNDSAWKDISNNINRLKTITKDELVAFPEGCALNIDYSHHKYTAILDSSTCNVITQRTGRSMKLFAQIEISKNGFQYREKGILPDGKYAFIVPGYMQYDFKR
jgi:hypothetical protein